MDNTEKDENRRINTAISQEMDGILSLIEQWEPPINKSKEYNEGFEDAKKGLHKYIKHMYFVIKQNW